MIACASAGSGQACFIMQHTGHAAVQRYAELLQVSRAIVNGYSERMRHQGRFPSDLVLMTILDVALPAVKAHANWDQSKTLLCGSAVGFARLTGSSRVRDMVPSIHPGDPVWFILAHLARVVGHNRSHQRAAGPRAPVQEPPLADKQRERALLQANSRCHRVTSFMELEGLMELSEQDHGLANHVLVRVNAQGDTHLHVHKLVLSIISPKV